MMSRRKSIFGAGGMKLMDITNRPGRLVFRNLQSVQGEDVLPWIEKYTSGDFYLSDFSIGFRDPNDMIIFMLAFNR
jgi:hypothetical protein